MEDWEGCLSIPGFREQVKRGRRVTVRAQNAKGEWFEMTGEDLLARARRGLGTLGPGVQEIGVPTLKDVLMKKFGVKK